MINSEAKAKNNLCMKYFSYYEYKYDLPLKILTAIALQESGRYNKTYNVHEPYPWAINIQGKGYYLNSKQQALSKVKKYNNKGIYSIDVGLYAN